MLLLMLLAVLHLWLFSTSVAFEAVPSINIPDKDILINADKGFILERIGTYSTEIEVAIIHTFVPVIKICNTSPTTDQCVRMLQSKTIQLASLSSARVINHSTGIFNRRNISSSIAYSMNTMLSTHGHGGFLPHLRSSFHFFEGDFYVPVAAETVSENQSETTLVTDQDQINDDAAKALGSVMEHFRGQKLGFAFLTEEERNVIVKHVLYTIDQSYRTTDVGQLIDDFDKLVLFQTLHAFRSCSMRDVDYSSPPCLIISTAFIRPSRPNVDVHTVFRIHAIPITAAGYRYKYANLPDLFGYNNIRKELVVWNDEAIKSKCLFMRIVFCFERPSLLKLTDESCLPALLSHEVDHLRSCDVARTRGPQSSHQNIVSNIWMFNDHDTSTYCEQLNDDHITRQRSPKITTNLIQLSCNDRISCKGLRTSSKECQNTTTLLFSTANEKYEKSSQRRISLEDLTVKLIRAYWSQIAETFQEIDNLHQAEYSSLLRIWKQIGTNLLNVILVAAAITLLTATKLVKNRLQNRLNEIEVDLSNLNDILIE